MKKVFAIFACLLLAGSYSEAAQQGKSAAKGMSDEELIRTAMSAAPPHISRDATIMAPGTDGIRTLKEGTNEFTCIADLSGQESPDPVCADKAATAWFTSFFNKEEKPAATAPGVAYMGLGGWHWEKDGQVVMDPATPGAKRVKEPPHWMILWPFDEKATGLPVMPNRFGAYVMYQGTPYSHLMIHQDPMKLPTPAARK
ncbi:MAG: hypothetical protein HYV23_05725 [Deltaproteobacteria bacterium]|nr:hypothetical protein [Deltaproteobacteria bacterium]